MEKNWKLKDQGNDELINHLKEVLNVDTIIARLLVQRNISNYDQARAFFRPALSDMYDPFLMQDMDKAVIRLETAIIKNEKILVYGDYDVDGTTSVALVYSFLKSLHDNIDFYIPDRYSEGYGISYRGIDFAAENNFSLVIALDCGIKAVEKIDYANYKNIDFIICDHHTAEAQIPRAVAVLDPKRSDCKYPFKELSGCGVGFKLLHAYLLYINDIEFNSPENIDMFQQELYSYLDLVTVSIASDIVPIIDENRVLAYFGLKQINLNPRDGIRSIMKIAGIDKTEVNISDVVFKIGPRINAAGRIESGRQAVKLLISDNEQIAKQVGEKIDSFNITRKSLDLNITREAIAMIEESPRLKAKKTTFLFKEGWHKGVIGIVASRLIEVYYRPTIILTQSKSYATGSARSVYGYNIYNAIEYCADLLENFGGHMYAAGLTLKIENISAFEQRFEEYVTNTIKPSQQIPTIEIDSTLSFEEITPKFFRILKQFSPFGPENMSPVFMTEDVEDLGTSKVVGKTKEHLKLELIEKKTIMNGIAFSLAEKEAIVKKEAPFNICYSIAENNFNGKTSLQLMVKDIKSKDDELIDIPEQ